MTTDPLTAGPAVDAQAQAEIERMREHLPGGCRMLSKGNECDCSLCQRDARIAALEAELATARRDALLEAAELASRIQFDIYAPAHRGIAQDLRDLAGKESSDGNAS